jgi:hypothetical protein
VVTATSVWKWDDDAGPHGHRAGHREPKTASRCLMALITRQKNDVEGRTAYDVQVPNI